MDTTWIFEKSVRQTLGERSLPDWKKWLRDNSVSLKAFLQKYYEGDLDEDLRMMRMEKIDDWLFEFVQSPQGLQAARMITPDHPELESSGEYDPTEAMLKAGPVAFGGHVLQAKERSVLEGVTKTPPPRNYFKRGIQRKLEFEGMNVEVLGNQIELELNKREALFTYMKERKEVDLESLPYLDFPESSTVVICNEEGLRPELLIEGEKPFRVIQEEEACVLDWGGEASVRIVHRIKDVTDQVLEYGQAEVTRQTYGACSVFVAEGCDG